MDLRRKKKSTGKSEIHNSSDSEEISESEYDPSNDDSSESESEEREASSSKKRKREDSDLSESECIEANSKQSKRSDRDELSDFLSDNDDGTVEIEGEEKQKEALEGSVQNSSLDVSVNVAPVGSVLRNKKNEFLLKSDYGVKKNVCFYCFEERKKTGNTNKKVHFAKLVQHYEIAHPTEEDIVKLKKIPKSKIIKGKKLNKNQIEREKILAHLRNKANHLCNLEAEHVSEFVVARRPTENKTVANYGTCYKCHKHLSLTSLHKHVSKCVKLSFKKRRTVKSSSRSHMGDYHPMATEGAIKIISKMREDDILNEIRYDDAAFYWLNSEASKYETTPHNHNKVRVNLRRLGNLKMQMKLLNDEIDELSDIFHEDCYDQFIDACKILGKADSDNKYLRSASTANEMSFLIKNVADIYHVMIGKGEKEKREEIDAFIKKIKTMWHSSIGNTIAETQARNRRNKVVKIPTQDDLVLMRQYLENEMLKAYNFLRIKFTDENYTQLRDLIVPYLGLINCRRPGEVEKLNMEDFNAIQVNGNDCRIQVRGKRTKPVPIVFDKQILKYLQLLVNNRHNARIHKKNPYIFSTIHDISQDYKFVSGCNLVNKFSVLCGAKNPETLRSTLFRMQVATNGMEQGIDEQQVEKLANYLGHTPRIHIQNYRQSLFERDVAVSNFVRESQTAKKTTTSCSSTQQHEYAEQEEPIVYEEFNELNGNEKENGNEEENGNENDQNASNGSIHKDACCNWVMVISQQTELSIKLMTERRSKIQQTEFKQSWKNTATLHHRKKP